MIATTILSLSDDAEAQLPRGYSQLESIDPHRFRPGSIDIPQIAESTNLSNFVNVGNATTGNQTDLVKVGNTLSQVTVGSPTQCILIANCQ